MTNVNALGSKNRKNCKCVKNINVKDKITQWSCNVYCALSVSTSRKTHDTVLQCNKPSGLCCMGQY